MPEREYINEPWEDFYRDAPPEWTSEPQPPYVGPPRPFDVPQTTAPAPPATTTPPPTGRHPQAGPDGSTTPNMDPPGVRGGYWMNGQWVQGSPYGGGGGGGEGDGKFDYGRPDTLTFSPYREMDPFSYTPFSYESFTPSSWEDAEKEPGFAESQARLAKMLQNTAAYRGVLRSGGTIGDIGTYLDQNKGQNFQQFDSRRFRNWGANRDNAANAWSLNLGANKFGYEQRAMDNFRFNEHRFRNEKSNYDDLLARWTALVGQLGNASQPV